MNPLSNSGPEIDDQRHIIRLIEVERAKIARELHDEAAQLLISAGFHLDQAIALLPPSLVALEPLREARKALDECSEQLHRLAFNLRPLMLDDLGLLPALRSLLKKYANLRDIDLAIELEEPPQALDSGTELAIFRIVQEAIANVHKHSQATRVSVHLGFTDEEAELEVSDDGVGFDALALRLYQDERPSLGLEGMRERALMVGGQLEISSMCSVGTTIRAKLPLCGDIHG